MENEKIKKQERRLLRKLLIIAVLLVTACVMLTAVLSELNALPCIRLMIALYGQCRYNKYRRNNVIYMYRRKRYGLSKMRSRK